MNVLANRVSGYTGEVSVNGKRVGTNFTRLMGYVTQDAPFFDTLTVRETLMFAARLRLPSSVSRAQKTARVDALIAELDLKGCAHTRIGKATEAGGISGGERRRLTLAMEMLFDPYLLFCDEVTSGLDSASALRIVQILRGLAHDQNRTVVCTIHQPRASVLAQFDNLLLLAGGRVVYFGPTWTEGRADGMLAYFAHLGFPFRAYENPADELLDLVNTDTP
ncbi:ATP-binding cassette domain-containing protein, partial [archaeon]